MISWIFWVIFSITLHELAHGWAAIWQGDDTPRRLGRMTANPLVHMGPTSLIVFAIIGIAWGMMPVDPSRFRNGRRGRVYVSGAGPAMNVALALACLVLLVIWMAVGPQGNEFYRNLTIFLWTGGWLNVLLACLNMLPIPPLDGSSVLSGLSFKAWRFYQQPNVQQYGFIALVVILITPIGDAMFGICASIPFAGVEMVNALLGSPSLCDVVYG